MTLGFTGTRRGLTPGQSESLKTLIRELRPLVSRHGGCHGADRTFHFLALRYSSVVVHPGLDSALEPLGVEGEDFSALPRKPYLERNRDIVDRCDLLVACPGGPEVLRSGTWATIRYARKAGKPHVVLMP